MRIAEISRRTSETDIQITLNLDGTGLFQADTGVGFLDHMLELFARHGRFDLTVACKGDTHVDDHHSVEDVGIALGRAFGRALGDFRGVTRYGSFLLPMDEALVQVAVDLSGRAHLSFGLSLLTEKTGSFDTQLVEEFLVSFVRASGATVHIIQLAGKNTHHIIEAAFKGLGRAMSQACALDPRIAGEIPSTKGVIL